jgi:hypothetical protein
MAVLEPDGKSLKIACTVYNQWSHCTSLPVNQSFQARIGKRGLEIRYFDQHGKMRTQLYEVLRKNGDGVSRATTGPMEEENEQTPACN